MCSVQQVNPESQEEPAQSILSIVSRILIVFALITLVCDVILIIHGLAILTKNEANLPDKDVAVGKIFLVSTTIISFILGLAILISIGIKKRVVTIICGILFILFVCGSLKFFTINYSLIGLVSNAILTLISVVLAVLIKNWRRT